MADAVAVVDCLTLWLSNVLAAEHDVAADMATLSTAIETARAPLIFVSNEVGLSIVPENALARRFRDHQGRLNQQIAAIADHVEFIAAGLPITLKGSSPTP